MTPHEMSKTEWSLDLQKQTRDAIEEMRCDPKGRLHFKHKQFGYATAELSDLLTSQFKLTHKSKKISYTFSDCDEIIASGWCVD